MGAQPKIRVIIVKNTEATMLVRGDPPKRLGKVSSPMHEAGVTGYLAIL